jgi:DNA repair protein RadC
MKAESALALSDVELLAKLIGVRQSRRQYKGTLQPFFDQGAGTEQCQIARELVARWLREEMRRDCVLTSPTTVKDYLRIHFRGQQYESFVCLFLDAQSRLIEVEELFRGTLTQTSVYPREVVKAALAHNAASVILSHNHPSGIAEPSVQDQALTRTLSEALSLVDIRVLDHLIVGGTGTFSFAERGLI